MKYDVLYRNGKIFTSDKENLYAEAMAVKDGKIAWVGKDADADPGSAAQVEDLGGKRVLPGFVDSHMHAIMLADCYQQISATASGGFFDSPVAGRDQKDPRISAGRPVDHGLGI